MQQHDAIGGSEQGLCDPLDNCDGRVGASERDADGSFLTRLEGTHALVNHSVHHGAAGDRGMGLEMLERCDIGVTLGRPVRIGLGPVAKDAHRTFSLTHDGVGHGTQHETLEYASTPGSHANYIGLRYRKVVRKHRLGRLEAALAYLDEGLLG